MRMYYAIYDQMVKRSNPGYGFCNTKLIAAFGTRRERDDFVEKRKYFDFSCRAIKRRDISGEDYNELLLNLGWGYTPWVEEEE